MPLNGFVCYRLRFLGGVFELNDGTFESMFRNSKRAFKLLFKRLFKILCSLISFAFDGIFLFKILNISC